MDYKKAYDNLMRTRKALNRKKKQGIYYEKHHMTPKACGGTDDADNLVLLTAREHYIAHLLLTQCYEGKLKAKMCLALWRLCHNTKYTSNIISAAQYESARLLALQYSAHTGNKYNLGKKRSDEAKAKMAAAKKGKPGNNLGKGRRIVIDAVEYRSIAAASRILKIHENTIHGRINSDTHENYKYI